MSKRWVERRSTVIMAADVAGYTKMMQVDEVGTFTRLGLLHRDIVLPAIERYEGRLFKTMGDGFLAEFVDAVDAAGAALSIQRRLDGAASTPAGDMVHPAMPLRIGISTGDAIVDGNDLFGDVVNLATRLEQAAPIGGILISAKVRDALNGRIDAEIGFVGRLRLKNFATPVACYCVGERRRPGRSVPLAG